MASTKVHFIFLAAGPGDHHRVCACNIGELETIGERETKGKLGSFYLCSVQTQKDGKVVDCAHQI